MKLNKKGFVSSAVLYSLLLLFLALILGLLALLSNRKQILDKLKGDIKSEINQTKNYKKYENGTAIYYNPVTGKICGNYSEENSKTGVTEGCLKWYIFNDDKNKATVNMILDHNTSGNVAWASLEDYIEAGGTEEEYGENGKNDRGPLTVTKRLNEDTEKWKNKTRLITADEIAKITGANLDTTIKWNSSKTYGTNIETESSWFYLDGVGTTYTEWQKQVANSTTKSKYAWLFDNNGGCKNYGCNFEDNVKYPYDTKDSENTSAIWGYWTNTPLNGISKEYAWYISTNGNLGNKPVSMNDTRGVRPVITVSKKDIYIQHKEKILNGADPVYSDNLIPVTIADNGIVTKADVTQEWYKYEDKKWANAVILNDETKTFNNGEIIPESDIESYFVWIPKYKYKLFDLGNYTSLTSFDNNKVHTIDIKFGNDNTSDNNDGECTSPASSGETGNCEIGEYMTHPAFLTFNTNGLWVGKFETGYLGATSNATARVNNSDSTKIIIKPNVYSWRNITMQNMFKASYNYKRENDSHMMKNTEWGAVAYLSHSKYGIATKIRNNNNSANVTGYAAVKSPTLGHSTTSIEGNLFETRTPGVDGENTINYLNSSSSLASTTGNKTGIYDMSGGSWEYVSVYVDGSFGDSGFDDTSITQYNKKYFDVYNSSNSVSSYNNRILGDATGETGPFYLEADQDSTRRYKSSWYSDYVAFVYSDGPCLRRGGYHQNGTGTGIFAFHYLSGAAEVNHSFRLVLTK